MSVLWHPLFLNRVYGAMARVLAGATHTARWMLDQAHGAWSRLRAEPWSVLRARLLLGFGVVAISVFWGMATAVLENNALYLVIGLILSVFILMNYSIGVVVLILFLPISGSKIFPHQLLGIVGLNPLNLLLMATLFSYTLRRFFGATSPRFLPRELWWLYIVPIMIAAAIGVLHIGDIPGFVTNQLDLSFDNALGYLRDIVVRPMYSVLLALLVAAAVVDARRIEGFMIAGLVSLWILILTIFIYFLASGASLGDISEADGASRSFFSPLGVHANAVGRLFAIAFGLLLFSASSYGGFFPKFVIWGSAVAAALATLITFSRGSYLLLLIISFLYVLSLPGRRRLQIIVLALPVILLAIPRAVYERFLFGLGTGADLNAVSSGRTEEIWQPLIPEIFNSPLFGHGLSSILWSDAMKSGSILVVGHPHNAFLKSLLDLGFIGTILLLVFGWRIWKRMRLLSQEPLLDPKQRNFFAGSAAALIAFTIAGVSGSSFDPVFDQLYLWLAIGLMYGISARLKIRQSANG